jgi:large subunit ribosomal protein L2
MTGIDYRKVLTRGKPLKSLTSGFSRGTGRNSMGRITSYYKGGGHKRSYRDVDFRYNKINIPAKIVSIEYDPNRSGFIGLAIYADGERRYILVPKEVKVGESFIVSEKVDLLPGNRCILRNIPVGTNVYNIEMKKGSGAKLVRSAGSFAQVVAHDNGFTSIKLPSSEIRKIPDFCFASIGSVSNDEYRLRVIGKAGRSRWLGIRPKTRAKAKNPVDHPYGGGEGSQPRGTKKPKTATGKVTGGRKTRKSKKYSNPHIVTRRLKNKKDKVSS